MDIFQVAEAFLNISPMTPKKLQKLCYYAYVWYYVVFKERLFDDRFEGWVHGPVNHDLYNRYKDYGWNDIPQRHDEFSADLMNLVEWIYSGYGHLDGNSLEMLTHQEEPWQISRHGLSPWETGNVYIEDDDIEKYYGPRFAEMQAGN